MDYLIANVDHIQFKIEKELDEQYGALPLPFAGMDSKLHFIIKSFNRDFTLML